MKPFFTLCLTVVCFGLFAQNTEQILWQMIDDSPEEMKISTGEEALMSKLLTETLTCTFFFDADDNNVTLQALNLLGLGQDLELFFPGFYFLPVNVPELDISGGVVVEEYTSEVYVYPGSSQSEFEWIVTGGAITSGQGTAEITVFWGQSGNGSIAVTETLSGLCPGEQVDIFVVIIPESGENLGCTSIAACNYNPEATADNGSCIFVGDPCNDGNMETVNDTIQPDCSCAGEDADPLSGCTDPEACNFSPTALVEDGSCEYVDLFNILGLNAPSSFSTETYTYPGALGSSFEWTCTGGVISSGQGSPEIEVIWGDVGNGLVSVTETTSSACMGDPVSMNIVILPLGLEEAPRFEWRVYPNPTNGIVNIDAPQGVSFELFDATGRIVWRSVNHSNDLSIAPALESGTYILRAITIDGRGSSKRIICNSLAQITINHE